MGLLLTLLRLYIVCLTLITIARYQNWGMWSAAEIMNPVCTTRECRNIGKLYQQNMNINGNPCTDFYDYACHNWAVYNPRPNGVNLQITWNVEQSLNFRAMQDMKKLLDSTNASTSREYLQAKLLYKTCMDKPFLARYNSTVVRNIMNQVGDISFLLPYNAVIPNQPSIWEIDERYIKLAGESALFDFKIILHPMFPSEIITKLRSISSPYGTLIRLAKWRMLIELGHYKAFLMKALGALIGHNQAISMEEIQIQIREVIDFRTQLGSSILWHTFPEEDNIPETIKNFQLWYNIQAKNQPTAQINWLQMIRAIYKNSDGLLIPKITEDTKVKPNKKYFVQLASLLGSTSRRTIVNHIHLYFLERHLELNAQMRTNLEQSVTVHGAEANGEVKTESYRWLSCINTQTMKRLLDKVYVNSFFPKKDKSHVSEFFEKAKELLGQQIEQSTWLNRDAKVKSIRKLRKLTALVGYPDWYDTGNLTMSNTEDIISSTTTAYYDNEVNRIFATAAYFQTPIYTPNVPYAIDYGSTVNVFGHELHHAFDEDGIKYDENGDQPNGETWWPTSMIKQHEYRSKCFHEQYEKYKSDEFQKMRTRTFYNIQFEHTLDEDIPDVMGLKLSYLGFKQMLQKSKGVCPVLPGMESIGCEKLFFIAFANNFCTSIIPAQQEESLARAFHSLPQIRVNGAVSNMKEFSAAFGCKANDPMNRKQTCDLWK